MGAFCVSEVSKRSKWYVPKYRYLELKYFCLQYIDWKRRAAWLLAASYGSTGNQNEIHRQLEFVDRTAELAMELAALNSKISLVEKMVFESDESIAPWLLKGVTEGASFVKLKSLYDIPCERDMYYDRYRKFFWLLDRSQ